VADSEHNSDLRRNRPWEDNAKRGAAAIAIAEVASIGVSACVYTFIDNIAPGLVKSTGEVLGKIIEPYLLDPIEWVTKKFWNLKEGQPDLSKSRQERAEAYGRFFTRFGIAFVPSIFTEIYTRKLMMKAFDVPNGESMWKINAHDLNIVFKDKAFQGLGAIAMGTVLAQPTEYMIRTTSNMLQKKLGLSEQSANRMAETLMVWQMSDIPGLVAAIATDAQHHHNKSL